MKTKKAQIKKRYVEVKRDQLAKNESQRGLPKKMSVNKLMIMGDNHLLSPSEVPKVPLTAKNITKSSKQSVEASKQSYSGNAAPAPTVGITKKFSSSISSANSNEYFSVRPKMMDHVNQQAQIEIIRSSSIEYEAHMPHGEVNGAEFNKAMANRRRPRPVHCNSDHQIQSSSGCNSATNQPSSSHASFIKHQTGPTTALIRHESGASTHLKSQNDAACPSYDLQESVNSNMETQIGSGKLPNINRTNSSGILSNGADFSSAVERFSKPAGISANAQ